MIVGEAFKGESRLASYVLFGERESLFLWGGWRVATECVTKTWIAREVE